MKLLLFGGTTEGRILAQRLTELGHQVTVCVATQVGAEELRSVEGIVVRVGRLDTDEIAVLVGDYALCVDATHPYAVEVTEKIRLACQDRGIPLRRVLRGASGTRDCVRVARCAQAAAYLAPRLGNVLVATGMRELAAFSDLEPERLYARVLPTHEALSVCERLGLPHGHIIAMKGPFSQALNEALLRQYRIQWLVSKDGGRVGGFQEKVDAAHNTGAKLILVERPPEDGVSVETLLAELGDESL